MSNIEDCPFCDPTELAGRTIYEDDLVCSILSNPRFRKDIVNVHALVIPKQHIVPSKDPMPTPAELWPALGGEIGRLRGLMLARFPLAVVLQKSAPYVPEGHNGAKVDHEHWHVVAGDETSKLNTGEAVAWTRKSFEKIPQAEFVQESAPTLEWLSGGSKPGPVVHIA